MQISEYFSGCLCRASNNLERGTPWNKKCMYFEGAPSRATQAPLPPQPMFLSPRQLENTKNFLAYSDPSRDANTTGEFQPPLPLAFRSTLHFALQLFPDIYEDAYV